MSWYEENLHADFRQSLCRLKLLYSGHTNFQEIEIFENNTVGRVLVLDGIVQTTEADEANYHEMLAHVPTFSLETVRSVLIIGGGDGGTLREILRHPVALVTLVEIDSEVIKLSRKYLPGLSNGAFEDSRVKILVDDGARFVAETSQKFDLIIVDSTDPVGPGKVLFERKFYDGCKKRLADSGVLVTQSGIPFLQVDEFLSTHRNLKKIFTNHGFYFTTVPTYSGGVMALGWASQNTNIALFNSATLKHRIETRNLDMQYYNLSIHQASFAVPQYLLNLIKD